MASTTRLVKTSKVAWSGMSSPLTRLMIFMNDTGIVNETLRDWETTADKDKQARKGGARSFFARLQMAYVFEILEAIKDIRGNKAWMAKLEACSKSTKDHFTKVCAFLDSADYKTLEILRNNACFHYADKLSVRAVEEIARKNAEDQSTFSQGDKLLEWHYELGDKVVERIVVHHIFKVDEGKDIGKESDAIANRIFDAAEEIALFAGRFIQEQVKA
jgi:hypothetical protein